MLCGFQKVGGKYQLLQRYEGRGFSVKETVSLSH